jgi:hypothetical protein
LVRKCRKRNMQEKRNMCLRWSEHNTDRQYGQKLMISRFKDWTFKSQETQQYTARRQYLSTEGKSGKCKWKIGLNKTVDLRYDFNSCPTHMLIPSTTIHIHTKITPYSLEKEPSNEKVQLCGKSV